MVNAADALRKAQWKRIDLENRLFDQAKELAETIEEVRRLRRQLKDPTVNVDHCYCKEAKKMMEDAKRNLHQTLEA